MQLNLLLFQDDQLKTGFGSGGGRLGLDMGTDAWQRSATPTGVLFQEQPVTVPDTRPSLLSRFLHNSVAGLPAPPRSSLLNGCAWLSTSAAKAKDVQLENIQIEVFNQKQAQPT